MSRVQAPQSAVITGAKSPTLHETKPDRRVFGLPWSSSTVLKIDADGSACIERMSKLDATDVWTIAAPGGTRKIAPSVPFPEALRMPTYQALEARDWALGHKCEACCTSETSTRHLALPRGPQWDQALRTALIGDWTAPLEQGGRIGPEVLDRIRSETKAIHRQLVPVWRRRVRGSRVMLLETPLGDNLTLLDLVAGEQRMADLVFEAAFEDERVNAVLAGLNRAERRAAMAWAHPSIADWTEAARFAGAPHPEAYGERVRRKLKRLGARHATRARAAAEFWQGAR